MAPVVWRSDNAIHWINLYPVDNAIRFAITYTLDTDLSIGWRCPPFIQLGPGGQSHRSSPTVHLKQIDTMLPWICTAVEHRRRQECGYKISDTLSCVLCATFLSLPHFDMSCDLLLNRHTATRNLFVNPLTLKISLVILLTVYHTVLVRSVWRIWYWINL